MNGLVRLLAALFAGVGIFCLPSMAAADQPTNGTASELQSIESLVSKVRESLVTIRVRDRDGDELGMGTGFVIDASGLIATNMHVINEGRLFTVELWPNKQLEVLGVEANNRGDDLAIVRVSPGSHKLTAIPLADGAVVAQGVEVLAFGNPLGLRHSLVRGIVSAVRDVDGREMIQLAMPIEHGNSGGPLVDRQGTVRGIINMKSAVGENVAFAIPVSRLRELLAAPNPMKIDRWARMLGVDPERWQTLFGARWRERSGMIDVGGAGVGFGGRALCLSQRAVPSRPFEIAVQVKLDDESGAAGLVFHADGGDRHYGFYPSAGNLRLTCFNGPTVYSWEVIAEIHSQHYIPGAWNQLKVRAESDLIRCFVNGHQVIESKHQGLSSGKIGLAKFRETRAEFRQFRVADKIVDDELSTASQNWFEQLLQRDALDSANYAEDLATLATSSGASVLELNRLSLRLKLQAEKLERLADDVRIAPLLTQLSRLFDQADESDLLTGALLVAALHHPDLDLDVYMNRVNEMAAEITNHLPPSAGSPQRLEALNRYLFEENGFHGGRDEYYHEANNHLDRVIDDREGMPITLSLLYMELGRRLGLTLEGIGLPGHFVVRYTENDSKSHMTDVFEKAKPLSNDDISQLIMLHAGRLPTEEDLRPLESQEILTRILHNLIGSAERSRNLESLRRYCEGLVAIDKDQPQFRLMRALSRYQTKRPAAACEDLDWLLDRQPAGLNIDEIRQMRQRIRQDVESLR